MKSNNPFTPYFGEIPVVMAGRRQLLRDVERAFAEEGRRPEQTMLLSGARGMGKTALLSAIGEMAARNGWLVASVTALPGMLEDIYERTQEAAASLLDEPSRHLTGVGIGSLVNVSWERDAPQPGNWRTRMNKLLDGIAPYGAGLLISVDEVRTDLDEMRLLAATYQHFTREGRRVALVMAGLPYNISALVNDKSVSFLRRAQRHRLGRVADADIAMALRETVAAGGKAIEDDATAIAVDAIGGFPFMLQLVGYRSWECAIESDTITASDAAEGVQAAVAEMNDQVLEATYLDLSEMDLAFLAAMLEDAEASKISDIAERMGKTTAYASQYRRRLLEAGVIREYGRGLVAFELPFFREYLADRLAPDAG